MDISTINTVGIVGCGLMGAGIAQIAAEAGFSVIVKEIDQPSLDRGLVRIQAQWDKAVLKGKRSQQDADIFSAKLLGTTSPGAKWCARPMAILPAISLLVA